jgi:hypothetical protein
MNKQIYNYGDQKPFFCMKTWTDAGPVQEESCCHRHGDHRVRQPIVSICPGTTWTKNTCDQLLQLFFGSCSWQLRMPVCGGDSGRPKWKTTTSFIGANVTGGVGQNGPKVLWTRHSLLGHSGNGSNCHIVTVGPRFEYLCLILGWTNSVSTVGFSFGLFFTRIN